jgi:predicted O-methyltransferase YrrM
LWAGLLGGSGIRRVRMMGGKMKQEMWSKVDDYFNHTIVGTDEVLLAALHESSLGGLPEHNVAPNQGKLLYLLSKMIGAKRILEIGTLGGYSTIWLGRSLSQSGKLVTLEKEKHNASIAQRNINHAKLDRVVEIKVGNAVDLLREMIDTNVEPFDLIFIDANKPSNPEYLELSLKLSKSGTVIIGDNVVRDGKIADENESDSNVVGVRKFFEMMANNDKIEATAIQTVGMKGYDGFSIAIVK